MNVNGVTNHATARRFDYQAEHGKKKEIKVADGTAINSGAVYESSEKSRGKVKGPKNRPEAETVANVRADNDARKAGLAELVRKMLKGQAKAYDNAKCKAYNCKAEPSGAAKDISANGYWGVEQTSQRILDFATAYAGDDPKKLEQMQAAFEKGYKMAEKAWGGKLPDVCRQTFDAVKAGFEELKKKAGAA